MDNATVIWMLATVLAIQSLVLLVLAVLLRFASQRQDKVVEVIQTNARVSYQMQRENRVGLEPNLLLKQLGGAGKPLRLINLSQHAIHLVNIFVYSSENPDNKKKLTPTDPDRISAIAKWLLSSDEYAELRVFSDERFSQLASKQGGDVIAQAIVQVDYLYSTKGNKLQSETYTLSLATQRDEDGKLKAAISIEPIVDESNKSPQTDSFSSFASDFTDGWTDQV